MPATALKRYPAHGHPALRSRRRKEANARQGIETLTLLVLAGLFRCRKEMNAGHGIETCDIGRGHLAK